MTNECKALGDIASLKSKSKDSKKFSLPAGYTNEEENSDIVVTPLKRDDNKLVSCPFYRSLLVSQVVSSIRIL